MIDLTDARLREIAEHGIAQPDGLRAAVRRVETEKRIASALIRTCEERDAAVARAEAADLAFRKALKVLRQSHITLAFAFKRLHESSRSRDGELCLDFQKARAQIEVLFKEHGVKL